MEILDKDIRFLYIHDTHNSKRVITIARTFDEKQNSVTFSFCVNHPTKKSKHGYTIFHGDTFSKKLGRHIATMRLNQGKSFTVFLAQGERPIEAIISFLAFEALNMVTRSNFHGENGEMCGVEVRDIPQCVTRICQYEYENLLFDISRHDDETEKFEAKYLSTFSAPPSSNPDTTTPLDLEFPALFL